MFPVPLMLAPLSSPSLELLRLRTLRCLLSVDARQDPAPNELLRVAAHALRCPMALISLLEAGQQWPKASFGLADVDDCLEQTLCAETLRHHDVRVVTDATLDPALAGHPMVTGAPGLRFYAGIALRVGGHRIGSLCVLDRVARTLDSEGRALLQDVAHAVEQWLVAQREQVLQAEREQALGLLAEQMPGVSYRLSPDEDLVPHYVSPQIQALGYTPQQWTRAPGRWLTAIHPDDLDRVLQEQAQGFERGTPFEMRYRLRTAAGQWVPVRDVVRVLFPADGGAPVAHGVILAQDQTVLPDDRHARIFQALPDGVLVVDAQGRVVDANTKALAILARTVEQLRDGVLADWLVAEAAPHGLAEGVRRYRYAHPDGGDRHLEATVGPFTDGLQLHVLRDVTARHEEESLLRKLSQAADQASEAIVITDLRANIEYVNQATLDSSGYTREELIGSNSRILQSGLTPDSRYRKLWACLLSGKPWRGFLNNQRKDGSHYIEFAVISPVVGPDGRVTHYLAVKEDITEKRRMGEDLQRYRHHLDELVAQRTDELEKARLAAESASAAKSAFLATMSHEIRTPMNGVVGIADVLQRSPLSEHQQDLVDTMRESALALLKVIDDILDFSKIEAGKLELERAPMPLRRLVEKAADALQPVAAARGVRLHAFVDPSLPETVMGDAGRLRQIIFNLVGNAIKFTAGLDRPGRVALRVLAQGESGLYLKVEDNGIGMSEDVQQRVFHPFVQGEASTTRHYGGTGLGLVITQRLVGAMQGSIELRSTPGAGSVFSVRLPLHAASDATPPEPSQRRWPLTDLAVWLALDERSLADDWARYLRAAGARVGFTQPGVGEQPQPDSVVICPPATLGQWPREALSSVHAVLVRHEPRATPRLVCAGLVELDCEGLHRDDLLLAVALAAGRGALPGAAAPAPAAALPAPPPTLEGLHDRLILVAEDNEINQKVIRQQLELLGLVSEHVDNGRVALERWRAGRARYALVLTDLHMPELDGYALTAAIREDEARDGGTRVPVVALTANVAGADAERCRRAGMDDFLSKPVQLERLHETLQQWLARPVAAPAARGPADAAAPAVQDSVQPDFDDGALQRLVGDDADVLADLQKRYLMSLGVALNEIAAQVQRKDWAAAGLTAHRLRTSSRAMGALRLGWLFERMETAGREAHGQQVQALAHELVGAAQAASRHFRPRTDKPSMATTPSVLCVDDDAGQLAGMARQLQALGVAHPETFTRGDRLLERLTGVPTEAMLLLLDLNMPQMDGVDLIRRLAKCRFAGMLVWLSPANAQVTEVADRLARAHGLRLLGRLPKPVQDDALRDVLERWPPLGAVRRLTPPAPGP
jgi:PAS domain S-box-containing protein